MLIEVELDLLVGNVDAELLEGVLLKVLKAKDVQDPNVQPFVFLTEGEREREREREGEREREREKGRDRGREREREKGREGEIEGEVGRERGRGRDRERGWGRLEE